MLKNTEAVVNAVRYAVRAHGTWRSFVEENSITRDQIAETAKALATLAYPTDEPVQKSGGTRTRFGNAVQAAGNGMRSVLDKDEDDTTATPDWLRLVKQAAENAHVKGEINAATILAAVTETLGEDAEQALANLS